ncbi:MAG: hypothetical protein KatS3mg114_0085 [Planctomycetaceae bacterium]|nr:MAG: hypothetical protein KatS3mg114_0085 [Planctomycetaceae bacterium]
MLMSSRHGAHRTEEIRCWLTKPQTHLQSFINISLPHSDVKRYRPTLLHSAKLMEQCRVIKIASPRDR